MSVAHLGPEEVTTVQPDAAVSDAVSRLESENVGSVVVAEEGRPVGMLTDRDVALAVGDVDDLASESVRSLMTEDPVTLHEDEEAMAISRTIGDAYVRRIPIVDDDDRLVGIATLDDLVATIGEQLDNVADTIEAQSPDYQP